MPGKPSLIGLYGKSGSGKDVVASTLHKQWGYRRIAIADPIKRICASVFNLSRDDLWGDGRNTYVERIGMTPREAFQLLGDACRNEDKSVWTRLFRREVMVAFACGERIVCPDIRTLGEVNMLREHGGVLWRIERPGAGAPGIAGENETENQLESYDDYDGVIINDDTSDDLSRHCEELFGPATTSDG
ncbi:MAG: hypothetical protein GY847_41940 [Proteobacteria bacterium]|nr:hypothetical protein [Pseudomonadota bacterium]